VSLAFVRFKCICRITKLNILLIHCSIQPVLIWPLGTASLFNLFKFGLDLDLRVLASALTVCPHLTSVAYSMPTDTIAQLRLGEDKGTVSEMRPEGGGHWAMIRYR